MKNTTMNALVYEGPRIMNMRKESIPEAKDNEVIIRVEKVGICGSELSGYLGHNSLRFPPLIMGHEFAGIVVELGEQVNSLKAGDRVTVNPLISCGSCRYCKSGQSQMCPDRKIIGIHRPGAFAEYVAVPENNVYVLPDHVTMDQGTLTEPLACAVHTARIVNMSPTDKLLIFGAGPIGLLVLQVAKAYGLTDIVVMDLNKERLQIVEALDGIAVNSSEQLKALMPEGGFDLTVDAVGVNATRRQSIELTRPGGSVAFSGLHEAESPIPINDVIRRELKLHGAFCYNDRDFEVALEWLKTGKVNLDSWLLHAPLKDGGACFDKLISNPGPIAKILLTV
jgi:2-desacetyl-2-hydroxyethyl bacteriochlorophyllide A dehydrogenase